MPELPEVETVRRGIASRVVGRRILDVDFGRERSVRRVGREAVELGLRDATMVDARRRGKYILCPLDTGDEVMIHLRMSGRVLVEPVGTTRPAHTHVVLLLEERDGVREEMWFVDPRTFGEVVVYDPDRAGEIVPELTRPGPDPIADAFDAGVLARRLHGKRGAIKTVLLDQRVVAGIGNIYADEILHRTGLKWNRPAGSLSSRTVERLAGNIVTVLADAIAAGGSTLDDTQYVDVEGRTGSFQENHRVYGREGEGCITCGRGTIRRTLVGGRSTCWCPRCQR